MKKSKKTLTRRLIASAKGHVAKAQRQLPKVRTPKAARDYLNKLHLDNEVKRGLASTQARITSLNATAGANDKNKSNGSKSNSKSNGKKGTK